MRELAAGDLTVDVVGQARADEIGGMAKAVQVFKDNGLKLQHSETAAGAMRLEAEAERRRADDIQAEAVRRQQLAVEAIARGLARLAGGDLVFRLQDRFAPEYEKLREDFNDALEKLQDTMRVLSGNTAAIRSGH